MKIASTCCFESREITEIHAHRAFAFLIVNNDLRDKRQLSLRKHKSIIMWIRIKIHVSTCSEFKRQQWKLIWGNKGKDSKCQWQTKNRIYCLYRCTPFKHSNTTCDSAIMHFQQYSINLYLIYPANMKYIVLKSGACERYGDCYMYAKLNFPKKDMERSQRKDNNV